MAALLAYCISLLARTIRGRFNPARQFNDGIQPFVKHKTLSYEEFRNKDLLIIGDVHGCFDEAMDLIKTVKSQNVRNFVTIFVGDAVNKGPKNLEMLDFLMKSKDVYCIRGNHEQAVLRRSLEIKEGKVVDKRWTNQWYTKLSPGQFEHIRNMPFTISIPMFSMIVVHAGLLPNIPLHLQNDHDMIHMRSLVWVKDDFHGKILKPSEGHEGEMWAECWPGPEHVYFGHDAIKRLQLEEHGTGLDTGCLYGKKLTGVLLRIPQNLTTALPHEKIEREFYSVDAKEAYVPVD